MKRKRYLKNRRERDSMSGRKRPNIRRTCSGGPSVPTLPLARCSSPTTQRHDVEWYERSLLSCNYTGPRQELTQRIANCNDYLALTLLSLTSKFASSRVAHLQLCICSYLVESGSHATPLDNFKKRSRWAGNR